MRSRTVWLLVLAAGFVTALAAPASAQTPVQTKYEGTVGDYVQVGAVTWLITGTWTLDLKGRSERGSFSAALNMVNPAAPETAAHTHHVSLAEGDVEYDEDWSTGAPRFTLTGAAAVTSQGNVAWPDAPITVVMTGGVDASANGLRFSNLALTFGAPASGHFGATAIVGVVGKK